MLSGIGPAEHLALHSIPLVHDLPGVGAHLQDHIVVDVAFRDESKSALVFKPMTLLGKAALQWHTIRWMLFGTGPMSTNVGEAAAFVRSTDTKLFPPGETSPLSEDSTSGPNAPDIEIIITPLPHKSHGRGEVPTGYVWSIHPTLLRRVSNYLA